MSMLEERLDKLDASLRAARRQNAASLHESAFFEDLDHDINQIKHLILSENIWSERYLLERLFFVQSSIRLILMFPERCERNALDAAEGIDKIRQHLQK